MRPNHVLLAMLLAVASGAYAASDEVKEAQAQRSKPLQRCDQLKDKAEFECLQRARERIVQARQQRQAKAQGAPKRGDNASGGGEAPKKN